MRAPRNFVSMRGTEERIPLIHTVTTVGSKSDISCGEKAGKGTLRTRLECVMKWVVLLKSDRYVLRAYRGTCMRGSLNLLGPQWQTNHRIQMENATATGPCAAFVSVLSFISSDGKVKVKKILSFAFNILDMLSRWSTSRRRKGDETASVRKRVKHSPSFVRHPDWLSQLSSLPPSCPLIQVRLLNVAVGGLSLLYLPHPRLRVLTKMHTDIQSFQNGHGHTRC